MPTPVTIPLLNSNEPDSLLASLSIHEGQKVARGEVLGSLETTKNTAEITAEKDGYVRGLKVQAGQILKAGEILCYLSDDPEWTPAARGPESIPGDTRTIPEGMRITQPALALAWQHEINLDKLPLGTLITEREVKALLESEPANAVYTVPQSAFDPTQILIYGGGGHGKMVIELLQSLHSYKINGILDDGREVGTTISGKPVVGGKEKLPELYQKGIRLAINAVGGIGNIQIRIRIFRILAAEGFACPVLIHPTARVDASAVFSEGAQVFTNAYVGPDVKVGFGVILNTGVIVSHDCQIGDFVNISPGAVLAGDVRIGPGALIGMGATVNLGVKIGMGARIGNSATVKADVPESGVVRAGTIWPADK
ncbi:MAG: hypothetical protein EHM41_22825 [Chloroflexi bacterium]|nr:MAG: hypothetical protein EHM41_22825 [Chloroflexota bacterium]